MKNTMIGIITVITCLWSGNLTADETAGVAASVDLNRIQNEVGYQRLVFLDTNDEVKAEILKLRTALDQALIECVRDKDDSNMAIFQTKIQSINNKLNTIRNALSSRSTDHRKALTKFIKSRYSEKYSLIIDAQMAMHHGQTIIWNVSEMIDLTDEIIQTLDHELP
ncbi:MAG: hypothetical protein JXN60_03165 [Lentisphaerae bacterium]|nr:hypothetical protein [Lentisphaerota bacterium]